jgi:hypothetical protein
MAYEGPLCMTVKEWAERMFKDLIEKLNKCHNEENFKHDIRIWGLHYLTGDCEMTCDVDEVYTVNEIPLIQLESNVISNYCQKLIRQRETILPELSMYSMYGERSTMYAQIAIPEVASTITWIGRIQDKEVPTLKAIDESIFNPRKNHRQQLGENKAKRKQSRIKQEKLPKFSGKRVNYR